MENLKNWIEQYVQGNVLADQFVIRYYELADELRGEMYLFRDTNPDVWKQIEKLAKRRDRGLISEDEFNGFCRELVKQKGNIRLMPYSKAEEIIFHLYVEADAYRPEAKGDEGWHIGEDVLLREAKTALKSLKDMK